MKSVRIQSYSGLPFPIFGLNTERYSVSLRIHSECGKIQIRITPNTGTFYAMNFLRARQVARINARFEGWGARFESEINAQLIASLALFLGLFLKS